jgi:hypothetical protein
MTITAPLTTNSNRLYLIYNTDPLMIAQKDTFATKELYLCVFFLRVECEGKIMNNFAG